MKISTRGRYALRFMVYLAENSHAGPLPVRDAAEHMSVNAKYLEQIISPLARSGLVQVTRGSAGGCRLSRLCSEYTALEILEAVEGNLAPTACLESEVNLCRQAGQCPTLPFWAELHSVIRAFLASKSLEDIIEASRRRQSTP